MNEIDIHNDSPRSPDLFAAQGKPEKQAGAQSSVAATGDPAYAKFVLAWERLSTAEENPSSFATVVLGALNALADVQARVVHSVDQMTVCLGAERDASGAGCGSLAVLERLDAIERGLEVLEPVFDENKKLRQRDFQLGFVNALATLIIRVIDGLEDDTRVFTSTLKKASTTREQRLCEEAVRLISIRHAELLGVLDTIGIEPFRTEKLAPLDVTRHKSIECDTARQPQDAGKINKSVRAGYWRRADGWVVRAERVNVFAVSQSTN